jgi:glycine cleavage system protein P-like pyridoxal-binding family
MDYIPVTEKDKESMLKKIGVQSIHELTRDLKPPFEQKLDLFEPLSELELVQHMKNLSQKNTIMKYFIGAGSYNHYIPSAINHLIARGEFLTGYTPYQAEMNQGTLQTMYEFQSFICLLTGMDVANGSLYEEKILEISDLANRNGTLMYCDGASMNALLGITRPSDQGFDMIHLNLHKSFSTLHGGGGPGAGAVGVKSFLADYLPLPRIIRASKRQDGCNEFALDYSNQNSVGTLRYCYGNFGMLVRAYSYIRSWGSNKRKISEHAILNANYLLSLLREDYELPYDRRSAHEFVLSSKKFGEKSALNIAKRLMDYGFHPPTIYFPLIVREALLIEPTETESRDTLDRFALALRKIASEIKEDSNIVKGAPYTTAVGRLDEVAAARKPNLRWIPKSRSDDL